MTNLRHYDGLGTARFVTFSCYHRYRYLERIIGELKSRSARLMLKYIRESTQMKVDRLSIHKDGRHQMAFWQRRCYDHNCRTPETVREKIEYCHKNPVTRGLVRTPADWRWSSYDWYYGIKDVPLEMDRVEL